MKYLIWYSPKTGNYNHGTETDYNVSSAVAEDELTVLYELEEEEAFLVKKIVAELNNARIETGTRNFV